MFSIIPAAGHSTRMGRPKLSLPLGGRTVLERVIDSLRAAGVNPLVVLGPHVWELSAPALAAGAMVLELPEPTPHMRVTVEAGLAFLEDFHPLPQDPWLLVPADHPALDAELIRKLIAEFARRPECSIAVPTFQGKRGHPALIRWNHAAGIRAFAPELGLNTYLRQFANQTLELSVSSPDVLVDLDTPEAYERLLARFY